MENIIRLTGAAQGKTRTAEEVTLSCRQVYRIQSAGKALRIQGVKGILYITLPREPEDYFLRAGEELVVRSRGLVLVQGLPEGTFRYSDSRSLTR